MISLPLLKRDLRGGFKLMIPFLMILTLYNSVIIWMYEPELSQSLEAFQEIMPELMSAVGMSGSAGTLIEFIHTYLYGFIMLFIPVIYIILLGSKLIMRYVDSGSIACLLATDHSRGRIIVTQMTAMVLLVTVLLVIMTAIGYGCSEAFFPGELTAAKYFQLNGALLLFHLAVSGICIFAACFFRDNRGYLAIGAGAPLIFYVIQMMANMGDALEKFKYVTIYTLMPGQAIIDGDASAVLGSCIALAAIWLGLYVAGGAIFVKKDLSV